jgi:uncharacterized protein (TIGR04222 family)
MALEATAETWGISGPTFLLAYLVLAVAVWIAGTQTRRMLADPRTTGPAADVTAHPHDVAYLNGGAELAVYSALSSMHLRGTITSSRGAVQSVGRLDPGTDGLERAIHFTARGRVRRSRLPFHRPVMTALSEIEKRLVGAGLLLSEEQRLRIRRVGVWMLAVAVLGLVRVLAGVAEAKPVGFLVAALIAVALVAVVQFARAPRRTRRGDRMLATLRTEHHLLSPEVKPDWSVHGPAGAALGVGIFGMGALWASDPAFADELAAERVAAAGWSGGDGGAGVSSYGDSSGGGGDGGGGGCGGGGCGGGGCGG